MAEEAKIPDRKKFVELPADLETALRDAEKCATEDGRLHHGGFSLERALDADSRLRATILAALSAKDAAFAAANARAERVMAVAKAAENFFFEFSALHRPKLDNTDALYLFNQLGAAIASSHAPYTTAAAEETKP